MMATSHVPPPMSTIMLPAGSETGSPTPIAAAIGSSTRKTSPTPAACAASSTARFSTSVMPPGTAITTRGLKYLLQKRFGQTLLMKYRNMASVMSKSAMTPLFIGRMAMMFPGVRPSMRLASSPTASTRFEPSSIATTEGSRRTMPRSFTCTSEFAVPRSMPISVEKSPLNLENMPILYANGRRYASVSDIFFHARAFTLKATS